MACLCIYTPHNDIQLHIPALSPGQSTQQDWTYINGQFFHHIQNFTVVVKQILFSVFFLLSACFWMTGRHSMQLFHLSITAKIFETVKLNCLVLSTRKWETKRAKEFLQVLILYCQLSFGSDDKCQNVVNKTV